MAMLIQCLCIALHEIPQHFVVIECHDHQHLPLGLVHANERQPVGVIGVGDLPYLKFLY